MLALLTRPLRLMVQAFLGLDSPRQLAFGVALGMLIGLVPKGNLLAAGLMVLLLATQASLLTGAAAAIGFSWVGTLLDPMAHRLGYALLTHPSLVPFWTWLYGLPMMPWTSFNNTVVLGSLVIGLWLFYPAYRLSRLVFEQIQPYTAEWIRRYRVGQVLVGLDTAATWRLR